MERSKFNNCRRWTQTPHRGYSLRRLRHVDISATFVPGRGGSGKPVATKRLPLDTLQACGAQLRVRIATYIVMKHQLATVALVCAVAPVQAQSWSGVYGAGNRTAFTSVELVQTDGGAVVGRFKQYKAGSDGKLELLDAPLSGAVSGNTFVGKIEARWFEGATTTLSGNRSGGRVELTGSGGFRATFLKSNESEVAKARYVR